MHVWNVNKACIDFPDSGRREKQREVGDASKGIAGCNFSAPHGTTTSNYQAQESKTRWLPWLLLPTFPGVVHVQLRPWTRHDRRSGAIMFETLSDCMKQLADAQLLHLHVPSRMAAAWKLLSFFYDSHHYRPDSCALRKGRKPSPTLDV
jgi:hypothetical protein